MCSATMTSGVHALAHSLMGGTGYTFYDNDKSISLSVPAIENNVSDHPQQKNTNAADTGNDDNIRDKIHYDPAIGVGESFQFNDEASAQSSTPVLHVSAK